MFLALKHRTTKPITHVSIVIGEEEFDLTYSGLCSGPPEDGMREEVAMVLDKESIDGIMHRINGLSFGCPVVTPLSLMKAALGFKDVVTCVSLLSAVYCEHFDPDPNVALRKLKSLTLTEECGIMIL